MARIKIDGLEFEWKNEKEFAEVKECMELLRVLNIEIERIKSANRIIEKQSKPLRKKENTKKNVEDIL